MKQKRTKKQVAILLIFSLILGLSACGSKESTSADTDSDSDGLSGEITWCSWGSDTEIEYNEMLSEAFMEAHPGTTVHYEALNDDYATTVETRYIGGQSPDVIYGHPATLLKWMQEGMLMDISDIYEDNDYLWDEDAYLTSTYELFQYDGKYFATVAGADTFVLFYNKTKLDEAGYDYPDANTTWEEIAEMAAATSTWDEDGIPLTMGMEYCFDYYSVLPMLYSRGGKFLDDMNNPTEVVFESQAAIDTLTWLQESANGDGYFTPTEDDDTYMTGEFATGDYTFLISGVYDIVYLTGVEDFEWDIAPLPGTMQEEGDTAILTAGYAVSSQTENAELAKEFVLWCTSTEAQKLIAGSGIFTPVSKEAAEDPEVLGIDGAPEHHSLRVETVPYGQNLMGQCLCWDEMMDVFEDYLYQLYLGDITPEECVTSVQEECAEILAEELND